MLAAATFHSPFPEIFPKFLVSESAAACSPHSHNTVFRVVANPVPFVSVVSVYLFAWASSSPYLCVFYLSSLVRASLPFDQPWYSSPAERPSELRLAYRRRLMLPENGHRIHRRWLVLLNKQWRPWPRGSMANLPFCALLVLVFPPRAAYLTIEAALDHTTVVTNRWCMTSI